MPATRPSVDPALSAEDLAFARALSRYARGLLAEAVEGARSPAALEAFADAAELDPNSERLQAKLASSSLLAGDVERAIAALQSLCAMNPTSAAVRVDLGAIYQFTGQHDLAKRAFTEGVAVDPGRTLSYWEACRSLFGAEQDAAALRFLADGLRRSREPNVLLAYLNAVSVQFLRSGKVDRAVPCLELLSRQDKDNARGLNLLAEAYVVSGDTAKAEATFENACALPSATAQSFARLAMLQLKHSAEAAMITLKKGRDTFPDDRGILFLQAYLFFRERMYPDAIEAFEALQKVAASDDNGDLSADFYLLFANACELAGQSERAERLMAACLELYPETPEALNYLAYCWAERGEDLDQAHEYVIRALKTEPENGAYADTLGWVYFQKKQFTKALHEVERANTLLGDDATVIDHLGDIHHALGDDDQAIEQWKHSLRLDPRQEAVRRKLLERGVDVDAVLAEPVPDDAVEPLEGGE